MRIALIGNGGREHALAWKLASSARVSALYCLPGNPGTQQVAENVDISPMEFAKIEHFAKQNRIDLVVIGPEDPLAGGLADILTKAGLKVFGCNKASAQLEADKWFAKEMMRQQAIPTAEARSFTDATAAETFVKTRDEPCVIKATGLAKGKGVTICYRTEDALSTIDRIMRKKAFGEAGARIVIEEILHGPECSILAFVDRRSIYVMEPAQDHKPVDDGDTGPMTGGMGAYSPTPVVTESMMAQIERDILVPIADALVRDDIEFKGVLYAGLMMTDHGAKVLEFNCRFGDPETQPLMMRMQSDLVDIMLAVVDGKLDEAELKWDPRPAVCVVATSKGYPGKYTDGVPITGIENADALPDTKVFQAGTRADGKTILTHGGRVLSVSALGNTFADAQKRAYTAMEKIHFDGMHYRRDIAHQAVR